jgi:hypothetical protein
MPRFGQPAGQRAAQRNRQLFIGTFKDPVTVTRFLWEDPEYTWVIYWEHYHHGYGDKGLSYPCVNQLPEFDYCIGCTWPVEDEFADDEVKDTDVNWRLRRRNPRYVVPTLNDKGFIALKKVSGTFRDKMIMAYKAAHSITNVDYRISRSGSGFDTKFDPEPTGDAVERKYTGELRMLYLSLADGLHAPEGTPEYEAAWGQWTAGNAQLGLPDINTLLGEKYHEAQIKYDISEDELARRGVALATLAGDDPGQSASQASPTATVDTANSIELDEFGRLAADITARGYSVPTDATLENIRMLHVMVCKDAQPAAAPVAAPVAAEQPVTAAPAQPAAAPVAAPPAAAQAAAQAPAAAASDIPDFGVWETPDIRDWMNNQTPPVPWDKSMPRSALITAAQKSITGY